MGAKTEQLQIRVTPHEKAELKRRAAAAGQDMSTYLLTLGLPSPARRFNELLVLLAGGAESRFVLAELNDLLSSLGAGEFREAISHAEVRGLSPFLQNYVAAMVEQVAQRLHVPVPAWTTDVIPLEAPWFATELKSLRLHLLHVSPVPFKRRNLFVDAAVGDRV